jgi:hypothetical protein
MRRVRDLVGLMDIAVLVVVVTAAIMPPRELYASQALKGDDAAKFRLGLAEARAQIAPEVGSRVDEFVHVLGESNFHDWAIEAGVTGAQRTAGTPDAWRAELATSTAYIEWLQAKESLDHANAAIAACAKVGEPACPSFERTRMDIYRKHLSACLKSGAVDATGRVKDANKCRAAGEGQIRTIRLR